MGRSKAVVVLVGLTLTGCGAAGQGYFHPPTSATVGEAGFRLVEPARAIVVLYTAGSDSNENRPPCRPGGSVPLALTALAGTVIGSRPVVVHGYCAAAIGDLAARVSMAEARAPELEGVIRAYRAQGVDPRRIFVAGHSMGGWAAILVGARGQVEVGGVIAFAPANGIWTRDRRGPYQWLAYERQKSSTVGLSRLDALLYLFHGDPFNEPDDLRFLEAIQGVTYRTLSPVAIGDGSCATRAPHTIVYSGCFRDSETETIRSFITERLRGLSP